MAKGSENTRASFPSGKAASGELRVPKSNRLEYDDDFVDVYDGSGKLVDSGMWDYMPYRDEDLKWNDKDGNYDLRNGFKLVVR